MSTSTEFKESEITLERLSACLVDDKEPIAKRTRAVFHIKRIGGKPAIDALCAALRDASVLLSHEVAYALGQMGDAYAVPQLIEVLKDTSLHPVTRHEAAEALGAISAEDALPVLKQFLEDEAVEVVDTCKLAVARMEWVAANAKRAEANQKSSVFYSVDPAPAFDEADKEASASVDELKAILMDESASLFQRYRAMFTLRNMNSKESVLALAEGFKDQSSALFRHEIAYVFGQMQHPAAVDALTSVLRDTKEHAMVRHEAAEALGSIATDEVNALLKEYLKDDEVIVKQSCEVALDLADYWGQ